MWIRSQDKTLLKNCNEIHINSMEDSKELWCSENGLSYQLGTYSSSKRALEILDDIQNQITSICKVSSREPDSNGGWLKTEYSDVCFEMPEK